MNKKNVLLLIPILFSLGCRAGIEPIEWKLKEVGKKIQSDEFYVYPNSYVICSTDLKGEKESSTNAFFGIFHSIGDANMSIKVGLDARWNGNYLDEGSDHGFVGKARDPYDEYFTTQIVPDLFTMIPYVGLEIKWTNDFSIGFDLGFPYTKWTARLGRSYTHYFQEYQKDDWEGFGMRYAGTVYLKTSDDDKTRVIISAFRESYDPEFLGEKAEIFGSGMFLGIEARF